MIVSWNWLKDYVTLDLSAQQAAERLMMSGLNLEEIQTHGDDFGIDLEVTSNRPDCLGHLGVARELSVLCEAPFQIPPAQLTTGTDTTASATSVENRSFDHCPHYMARVIRGVKVGPSPAWLQERLAVLGLRSVNNVVDVTNYVLMECGQPLHAFDLNQLQGQKIVVRQAEKGEKIVAIDGRTYELDEQTCVIADASRPVAIAGVMGGQETEVTEQTTDLLIETALFAPLSVRRTARKLSLFSDSSFRFERGLDAQQLDWASRRCCELIVQLAGGEILDQPLLAGEIPEFSSEPITLRTQKVQDLLGIEIPTSRIHQILLALGLQEQSATAEGWVFTRPSWRADLTREVDLIEEVARIYGYDQIPENDPPKVTTAVKADLDRTTDVVHRVLNAAGFYEAMTLTFSSEGQCQLFNPRGVTAPLRVEHSSRRKENLLRPSLIPSLLVSRRANERTGTPNASLYEIARVFTGLSESGAEQILVISGVTGYDFLTLKGLLQQLLEQVNRTAQLSTQPTQVAGFMPGRGAELLLNGQRWGWMGEVAAAVTNSLDLKETVTAFEVDLQPLVKILERAPQLAPIAQFPAIERDFNFLLNETVSWQELAETIQQSAGSLLESIQFAGEFRGKQLGAGKKTYLARTAFRSPERTLTGEEVDQAHADVVQACQAKLEAVLR